VDFSGSSVSKTPAEITIDGEKLSCGYAYIRHDENSLYPSVYPDSLLYSLYFNSFDWFEETDDSQLSQIAVFFWLPKDETLTDVKIKKFTVLARVGDSKIYSNGKFRLSDDAQLCISKKDDIYSVSIDNFAVSGKELEKEETSLSFCNQLSSLSDILTSEVFYKSYIYTPLEQMPAFPGGNSALSNWISRNLKYPAIAEENGIQGKVTCTFVVDFDGSVTDVKVISGVDVSLDKEAIRVLENMPSWIPGMQLGAFVRIKYTIPITFRLQVSKRKNNKSLYNPSIIIGDLQRIE
jgi:TonB family protein